MFADVCLADHVCVLLDPSTGLTTTETIAVITYGNWPPTTDYNNLVYLVNPADGTPTNLVTTGLICVVISSDCVFAALINANTPEFQPHVTSAQWSTIFEINQVMFRTAVTAISRFVQYGEGPTDLELFYQAPVAVNAVQSGASGQIDIYVTLRAVLLFYSF